MELTTAGTPPAAQVAAFRRMPDFSGGRFAHRHTVHSALASLAAIGVASERVLLRRAGREAHPTATVVGQAPRAGDVLHANTPIRLDIAGLGFSRALPAGMWDSGGEAVAGTQEILEAFDDPLEKLRHWFHEGAPLFRISPEDLAACANWLALFGVRAETWPRGLWYPLASLIANMPTLACSQTGCAFVLDVLLGLPVRSFTWHRSVAPLPAAALSGLGAAASRLGVDLLVGDEAEDLARLEIEIGPVELAVYDRFTADGEGRALLARILRMLMPVSTSYDVRWAVLDQARPPRLGMPEENARLGINTHMGTALPECARGER